MPEPVRGSFDWYVLALVAGSVDGRAVRSVWREHEAWAIETRARQIQAQAGEERLARWTRRNPIKPEPTSYLMPAIVGKGKLDESF